jgi:hypothetical protein
LSMKVPTEAVPLTVKAEVTNLRSRGLGLKFVDVTEANLERIRNCFDAFKDTIPIR